MKIYWKYTYKEDCDGEEVFIYERDTDTKQERMIYSNERGRSDPKDLWHDWDQDLIEEERKMVFACNIKEISKEEAFILAL